MRERKRKNLTLPLNLKLPVADRVHREVEGATVVVMLYTGIRCAKLIDWRVAERHLAAIVVDEYLEVAILTEVAAIVAPVKIPVSASSELLRCLRAFATEIE